MRWTLQNVKRFVQKRQEVCILLLGTIFIFFFYLRHIEERISPAVLMDEFGYWATAAQMTGRDWSGVASTLCSYYSYGYGLILAVLMKVFTPITVAYQMSIVLNSLMICVSIWISYSVSKRFFTEQSEIVVVICCLVIALLPAAQFHSQYAWSETILMFTFWVNIWLLQKVLDTESSIYTFAFGVTLFYMYMIHQRSLGIVCVGIFTFLLIVIQKRIGIRQILVFAMSLLVCFLFHVFIKTYMYENLWENMSLNIVDNMSFVGRVAGNDFGGQIDKIKALFSGRGMMLYIVSILGKLSYAGSSTLFLCFEGFYFIIKNVTGRVKGRYSEERETDEVYVLIYIFLSFAGTLAISALTMLEPWRIDIILYGRYTDWLLPPIVLLGMLEILEAKNIRKRILSYTIFLWSFLLVFIKIIAWRNLKDCFESCVPIMYFFRLKIGFYDSINYVSVMFLTLGIVGFFLLGQYKKRVWSISVCTAAVWLYVMSPTDQVGWWKEGRTQEYQAIIDLSIGENEIKDIYYIFDAENVTRNNLYIGELQFLLDKTSIHCMEKGMVEEKEDAVYIFPEEIDWKAYKLEGYEKAYKTDNYTVICFGKGEA